MKLVLKEGTPEHADAMAELEALSFSDPWSVESFREMLAMPVSRCLTVWDEEETLVGYLLMLVIPPEAEIANIAVSPAHRKQGIGRLLMDAGIAQMREVGCDSFYLEVRESNIAAQALYRRLGFEQVGRRKKYYQKPTEDALLMALLPE